MAVSRNTGDTAISRDLISLTPPLERALLVGAPRKGTSARHHVDQHLDELEELADTAGAVVVGSITQQIDRPNPATYLGKGKIDELGTLIADVDATLIIFDDELTPAQGKNVEDATGKRVMDRAELILDIFATRARTSEAKMQVELAQLEYMLPRLTRMWTHLEKFRGGIGMRGPGETQLETDRRLINHRIKLLKERLTDVTRAREVQRQGRRGTFEEVNDADLLLHVIDASHAVWEEHRLVVDQVLEELGALDRPVLHVFNKVDALDHDRLLALQERVTNLLPNSVFVSATTDGGLEPLRR